MKTKILIAAIVSSCIMHHSSFAATTIDSANRYAYGANLGWINGAGDTNHGAVIGEYVCSGYIYSANVGWISLGNGTPADGIYYQNNSAADFGVNQDGVGNLRGYAYGANIGWLNFESTGAPKVDLASGNLSGYVWSANCGWISLSNAVAYVQTDTIQKGALAPDGLPIAWLLQNFGTTNVNAGADPDHDGMNNLQEYLAGTDPNNGGDFLRITNVARASVSTLLQWTAKPARFYSVQSRTALNSGSWDGFYSTALGAGALTFNDTNTNDFFRVEAYRPLTP
ncbi:MAG TPA: hypothetical protein VIK59_07210 [Verrucomicrobiae bacterium]